MIEVRMAPREYRVRFAELGATEVEGNVDFILDLGILAEAPVVSGSFVHPLRGGTELRPLQVVAVDDAGILIQQITSDGRWTALGRLVDLQYREVPYDL